MDLVSAGQVTGGCMHTFSATTVVCGEYQVEHRSCVRCGKPGGLFLKVPSTTNEVVSWDAEWVKTPERAHEAIEFAIDILEIPEETAHNLRRGIRTLMPPTMPA